MTIQYSQVPAIYQALQEASKDEKLWLGYDSRIQIPSVQDLHFFDTEIKAADFKHYHGLQGKEISLLPVEATRYFLHESTKSRLQGGVPEPSIELDTNAIYSIHHEMVFNYATSMLEELMDTFDWSKTFYDPLEANAQAERVEDKIQFGGLEFLVEQLSVFAQTSDKAKAVARDLMQRHWSDHPMEAQIENILRQSLINHKTNVMNDNNFAYLKDNVKYTGFGESLYSELERNIKEQKPEFQLDFAAQVNNKAFNATLYFRKSNTSDMYFFNRYTASMEKTNGEKVEQSFSINKGKGVTAKEAYNLLEGRSVKKELTNSKGESYLAWMQLDFDKKDNHNNYVVNKYNENYGYNLRDAVAKFPVLELDGGEKEKDLLRSLERGNLQMVTIDNNGRPEKIFLEANAVYKTVNVYNEQLRLMKHEELPIAKHYVSQSIGEDKNGTTLSRKQTERNSMEPKKIGDLLPKKHHRQNKGPKIS